MRTMTPEEHEFHMKIVNLLKEAEKTAPSPKVIWGSLTKYLTAKMVQHLGYERAVEALSNAINDCMIHIRAEIGDYDPE